MIWYLLIASPISGCFGRLGGAGKAGNWYDFLLDTKWRDLGCALLITLGVALWQDFSLSLWWLYCLVLVFHFGALCTYWDWLFAGEDNLWFSGIVVGLALAPVLLVDAGIWWIVLLRAIFLGVWWEFLNKKLPQKIFVWRRDVVEEFLRYASIV